MSRPEEHHPGPGWVEPTAADVARRAEAIAQPFKGVKSHLTGVRLVATEAHHPHRYMVRSTYTGEVFGVFGCWVKRPKAKAKQTFTRHESRNLIT